jgi:hypothetical protein
LADTYYVAISPGDSDSAVRPFDEKARHSSELSSGIQHDEIGGGFFLLEM